jgi:GNAT superfamily N-acetyltransferase
MATGINGDPYTQANAVINRLDAFAEKRKKDPILQRIFESYQDPNFSAYPKDEMPTQSGEFLAQDLAEINKGIEQRDAQIKEGEQRENLEQRKMLRGRITETFGRGLSPEDRDKELIKLEMEGSQLGIDPAAMQREIAEEQGLLDRQASRNRRYDDFFARANDPNRTLGSGSRREVYSRKKRLRLAKQLRKQGFGRAAEAVALDYARSPEAMAPAVSTPAMRQQREIDSSRASEIREMNRGLTQLLLARTRQQLRDPEFRPFA